MPRLIAILTLALVVASAAGLASADSGLLSGKRSYTDRVLAMEDTAAAHADLARWCAANALPDRAKIHWEETLVRDADHREARAALGYVRRGMKWVQGTNPPAAAAESAAAPAPVAASPAPDPAFLARQKAHAQQIQSLSVVLGSSNAAVREPARREVLTIHDPAAAEPIARLLGGGTPDMRVLACEALAGIPGEEAGRLLARLVLTEPTEDVYKAAVAALAARADHRGVAQLVHALDGSSLAMKRSAHALGEMREWRAAPALIAHLRRTEPRIYNAPAPAKASGTGAYFFSGNIQTYIADVQPVVAEAAVGWDPTIGAIPTGAMLSVRNPVVTIHRTIYEFVPQPVVREALRKITGRDFEYNTQAWRDYLERRQSDRIVPIPPVPPIE